MLVCLYGALIQVVIFLLKAKYLNIVYDDLEEMMTYKEGSTQYVSETLKRADNIRLYD